LLPVAVHLVSVKQYRHLQKSLAGVACYLNAVPTFLADCLLLLLLAPMSAVLLGLPSAELLAAS
jgi:hypothetical protein